MSLLDDVSIVVTPNGYKAGTLYGVLPTATEGSDLVTNGGFDTDSDWNGSGSNGWTISGGKASNDGTSGSNNLSQSGILEVDKRYKIDITVSNYVSGNVEVSAGASPRGRMTANGTYTFYQTCTPSTAFYIIANSFDGSVDNVSVKEWTASDMDVTRATAATRVDENGLVNYAEVLGSELVDNGSFTTDSDWYKTGTWSIESNYATATANSTSQYIQQDFTITNGKTYLFTYEIIENTLNGNGASLSGSGGFVSVSLSSVIGTHQVYITADDSGAAYALKIGVSGTATTGTIKLDNVSVKEVTRDNVPRIDYTGGGCPHILAEPQRTNLVTYSEDFSNWSNFRSTLTPNETTSPDGTINAYLVEQDYPNTSVHGGLNKSIAVTNGVEYTYSFFVKKKEYSFIELAEAATSSGNVSTWFDVENGVVGNIGAGSTAQIEDYGNGWYRCSITFTSAFTGGRNFVLYLTTANGSSVANIVGGAYIWGAQLEAGSYPTSYIPTSGSTVTRNQDVFTRDGIGSLINDSEGVLFVEAKTIYDSSTSRRISLSDGSINNRVMLEFDETTENTIKAVITTGGVNSAIMTFAASDLSQYNKIAIKYKLNDFSIWFNGTEVVTDSSGGVPTGLTQLVLDGGDGSNFFYGEVKQLQVYNTALTDMQLIQLTGTAGTDFYESYSEMAESLTYTIQ